MIDSHIHLDDPRFDPLRDEVVARARAMGVTGFVVPAISRQTFPRVKAVRSRYPGVFAAYGLHPYFIEQHDQDDLAELDHWLHHEKPVAVGECGLDFYLPELKAQKQRQLDFFLAQIELAKKHDLPLIIHARKAVPEVLACLREVGYTRGEIHSYNTSLKLTRQVLDAGLKTGFGGAVTRPNAHRLHQVVAYVPDEAVLLETDAPDQPPWSHRGELNRPEYLPEIARCIAKLRGQAEQALIQIADANARELFDLPEVSDNHPPEANQPGTLFP